MHGADLDIPAFPDDSDHWEPDAAACAAAGSPSVLATAVADHLLAIAESPDPPAFIRAQALAPMNQIQVHLPADVNARHAERLLAIAENPQLNAFDQMEIASAAPLSRGHLNLGAGEFPALALLLAANAAAAAARTGAGTGNLSPEAGLRMITQALRLLRAEDPKTAWHGAAVLTLARQYDPSLPDFTTAIVSHPNTDVRAVAAARAMLSVPAQQVLVTDPSPQVRANLASRARELAPETIARLQLDEHPDVKRALAGSAQPTSATEDQP